MNELGILIALGIGLTALLAGPIVALVALLHVNRLERRLAEMEGLLKDLYWRPPPPRADRPVPTPEEPLPTTARRPEAPAPPEPPSPPSPTDLPLPPPPTEEPVSARSLEFALGTRWFARAGVVMLLFGVAYFLKYAYDNEWIGPRGRLAIGVLAGLAALALGERYRRKGWRVFFQTLTGGGLAAFYLCIFYSFQVYHLLSQAPSFALGIGVTALAVALAVTHDSMAIAVLALVGGFLSPVLLSTGENHPHALFLYLLVLNLTALGCACFRRWRALDSLCFAATALLYLGWFLKFYGKDQMFPALLYNSLFYLVFTLSPLLNSWIRKATTPPEALAIPPLSAVWAFLNFYLILYEDHRQTLGFVVLGQALILLGLFWTWSRRMGKTGLAAQVLLTTALALTFLSVPIHLRFYGVPLAWAAEGVLLIFVGRRQGSILCRVGGLVALILAFGGLLGRLPMHESAFTPLWNVPLGSWTLVTAAAVVGMRLLKGGPAPWDRWMAAGLGILAYAAGAFALSCEAVYLWEFRGIPLPTRLDLQLRSLIVLWALIPAGTLWVLQRRGATRWGFLTWTSRGIGGILFFAGLTAYDPVSRLPFLHAGFAAFLAPILSAGWAARRGGGLGRILLEAAGHGGLAILLAVELIRWSRHQDAVSSRMALSLVSAAWAIQAFVLIWLGLRGRDRLRRYVGFTLFLLTLGKVWLVDMSALEPVYRVLSFAACGFLLLVAGLAYQRFSAAGGRRGEPSSSPPAPVPEEKP